MNANQKEIEDLAWKIFLNKNGLSFIRELTAEEKKKILDVEVNEWYRQEALKMLEKKQRAVLNKKYPVINVPSSGKRKWCGGAYTLCFVYSKYKGNFVLRGYHHEVEEYLKKNYTHYFYNMSLWHQGFNRDIWGFWKKDISIFEPSELDKKKKNGRKKIEVRPYSFYGDFAETKMSEEELKSKTFKFKRLPKRWIPEFNIL